MRATRLSGIVLGAGCFVDWRHALKTVPAFAVIGTLGAIVMFFSAFVRHWSFTIVGAIGVLVAVGGGPGNAR